MKASSPLRMLIVLFFFCTLFSTSTLAQSSTCILASTATPLDPDNSCNPVTGNLEAATSDATTPAGSCGGATTATTNADWFRFTAESSSQIVTVSLVTPTYLTTGSTYIEVLQGSCGMAMTSLACQTVSAGNLTVTGLTVGTQYYLRVYVTGSTTANSSTTRRRFTICVINPPTPPSNDACVSATMLTSSTTCTNTAGTLLHGTSSSPTVTTSCGVTPLADVWYSFVAQSAYPTIALSSIGSSLRSSTTRLQLLSGSCGSFTELDCVSGTNSTLNFSVSSVIGGAGLIPGNTYYIRIYTTSTATTSGTWSFNICVTDPAPSQIEVSRSYINVSKSATGGTVNPGDTLEMRSVFVVTGTGSSADSLGFYDTLFNGNGLRLIPNSIALRTNEGKVYGNAGSPFTDAFDTDLGWSYSSGLDTVIRINFGANASRYARGRLNHNSRPSVFGGTCIVMATYRVVVYAPYNSQVNFRRGAITYRDVSTGVARNATFTPSVFTVYQSPGLCPNAVSPSNALGAEFNGTFGAPAPTPLPLLRDRGTSPYTTYTYAPFGPNAPGDYYYGIANNTSGNFTTTNNYPKPLTGGSGFRVFEQWDITGDHTGASNPQLGNPACDINQPISPANPCGYMLVVNSAYRTDTAFTYTVSNLCPNTYYEISAWFKNICYKCGCDSTGASSSSATYIPSAPGDSSGVQPNIAFDVNGSDYYTTGNLRYLGTTPTASDANNQWVKRGFTYLTGAGETSFTLTLRNNAPGGGGNDWALDDIAVATCSPNMNFTPTATPTFCDNNVVDIGGIVTSYFDNYTYYKWQKSVDGGANWTETGVTGSETPATNGNGEYEYSVSYPQFVSDMSDSGSQYRLIVATSSGGLGNSCFVAGEIPLLLNIDPCTPTLGTSFISFVGKAENGQSLLRWTTTAEAERLQYIIERSRDGRTFEQVGLMNSHGLYSNTLNSYNWSEPFSGGTYHYRIKMISSQNLEKYSKTASVRTGSGSMETASVVNPFYKELVANVHLQTSGLIRLQLIDNNGNILKTQNAVASEGNSRIVMSDVEHFPAGLYTMKIITPNSIITKKVIKQ